MTADTAYLASRIEYLGVEVTIFRGIDDKLVVEIDTAGVADSDSSDDQDVPLMRVYVNEGKVWEGPEDDPT